MTDINMSPLVSIIVPVYNVQKYVLACLESIDNQTYGNYEAILIDDGSTDKSADIIREFIKDKEKFLLIQKQNGGVSSARNTGISIAKGEWLTFVDADDYIEENFLSNMIRSLKENPADLCLAGYCKYYEETGSLKKGVKREPSYGSFREMMDELTYIYIWAKIYSTKVIKDNDIRFNEKIYVGEDRCFNFDVYSHVDKCLVIDDVSYIYRRHAGNSTANSARPEKKKHLYQHARAFWESFEDEAFITNEYAKNHHLAHNILDCFFAEVINAVISQDDGYYRKIVTDKFARALLENYNFPDASKKEKFLVFLLRNRLLWITKCIIQLYYSDMMYKKTRSLLGKKDS